MSIYYNRVLEPDSHYVNLDCHCTLPNDNAIKDPEQLVKLSGPVITYYIESEVKTDEEQIQRSDIPT